MTSLVTSSAGSKFGCFGGFFGRKTKIIRLLQAYVPYYYRHDHQAKLLHGRKTRELRGKVNQGNPGSSCLIDFRDLTDESGRENTRKEGANLRQAIQNYAQECRSMLGDSPRRIVYLGMAPSWKPGGD